MDAFVDIGLLKLFGAKRGGILVHGPPNVGKMTVIEMVRAIYHCDNYIIGKSRYAVGRASLKYVPHFVLMDDPEVNKNFHDINDAKRLLEGFGIPCDNKYGGTEIAFENCTTIICCNGRPVALDNEFSGAALRTRIQVVNLDHLATNKLRTKFPFTVV